MFTLKFKTGIDFAGGSVLEISVGEVPKDFQEPGKLDNFLRSKYGEATGQEVIIQSSGNGRYLLKSKIITNEQKEAYLETVRQSLNNAEELRFETVSPTISKEVTRKAVLAVIVAVIGILLYISLAFRRVPRPTNSFKFAMAAVVALTHDSIILLGSYSLMGYLWGAEVNGMFVVALLTLLGLSIHDTIVTFDRFRENLKRRAGEDFAKLANDSVTETITRSLNTSFTLVLILLAIIIFGGATLRFFAAALLIGYVIGTYSSIFVATPLLVSWQKEKKPESA